MLGRIKRLLKTGSRSLSQVAKRLIEQDQHYSSEQDHTCSTFDSAVEHGQKLKNMIINSTVKSDVQQTIDKFSNGFKYYLYNRAELDNFDLDCTVHLTMIDGSL